MKSVHASVERADDDLQEIDTWFEVLSTVLLALATVATAWSGYQATRWSGEQAHEYSVANAARLESTRASALGNRQLQIDAATFAEWVNAYEEGNAPRAAFYRGLFSDRLAPAIDPWIATNPVQNPNAPNSPFEMPQYTVPANAEAERLFAEADAAANRAARNNQRGDNYVLAVVLFAAALFFGGVSTRLPTKRSRRAILALGCVLFVCTLAWISSFPVSFGL